MVAGDVSGVTTAVGSQISPRSGLVAAVCESSAFCETASSCGATAAFESAAVCESGLSVVWVFAVREADSSLDDALVLVGAVVDCFPVGGFVPTGAASAMAVASLLENAALAVSAPMDRASDPAGKTAGVLFMGYYVAVLSVPALLAL